MTSPDVLDDMDVARGVLSKTGCSIVVVKDGKVLAEKHGKGIRPILDAIVELDDNMRGTVVGDRILGKASALLCVHSKVDGVYSPQATKTAIAVLIRASIPGQTEEIIPFVKNREGDDVCPFEKMLIDIDSPEEAYKILKEKVIGV
jgi:hypothetical protein